ncbi:MAG: carboxyl transferase domain-containing protein, partial [Actinomycetota bacterium]
MQRMWDEVAALLDQVPAIGGQRYVDRHRRRGKMLVRERVEALIDPDTPFLELSPLAAWGTQDPIGVGVVSGIGVVEGVECAITGTDMSVKGGAANPTTWKKQQRFFEIARENRLPLINLNESAGADLPRQADLFIQGGQNFRDLTRLSKEGIPTITVAFGPNTAGGAYVPGMSDYTVFVKERGTAYLGGPPLVKMAIDEIVDEETLGGAEMHSRTSGLSDYFAQDEMDGIRIVRQIVRHLDWKKLGPGPTEPDEPPLYDPQELLGVAPADVRIPFDIREVYARLLDGSRFEEFKRLIGEQLVCGWGSIHGFAVGLIGNNGILFSEEAKKGAQFIQLCNRMNVPIVFLHNITGFMVGSKAEQGGIIRNGAKMINAVSNSEVPHFNLMVGASYGAGNYGMAGKSYEPRFIFTWPNHRVAVMGPKQLAGVMEIIARNSAAGRGVDVDEEALLAQTAALEAQIEEESTALYSTGRLWDDGI